jgi:hypothetical protein
VQRGDHDGGGVDAYREPFCGGQGPVPAYAMALSEANRESSWERIRERLPIAAAGTIRLTARAWAVRGAVAR